jgi:hypothetical protein
LADALQAAGRRDEAVAAFAAYLARDPSDVMGAPSGWRCSVPRRSPNSFRWRT